MTGELLKLRALCRKWGGDLLQVEQGAFEQRVVYMDLYEAPGTKTTMGVSLRGRQVVYVGDPHWADVIHEMGHLFATRASPERAAEYAFFGWEYAVARYIRGSVTAWYEGNREYNVPEKVARGVKVRQWNSFGNLTRPEQRALVRERLAYAKVQGLVDAAGRPRLVRASNDTPPRTRLTLTPARKGFLEGRAGLDKASDDPKYVQAWIAGNAHREAVRRVTRKRLSVGV